MKRKYLFLFVIALMVLTGCNRDIQISELTYEDTYVKGTIKNTSSKKAYDVTVIFKYKSGSLIEEDEESFMLKPEQTKDIEIYNPDINESYEISVKKITTKTHEIPEPIKYEKNGVVSKEQLEYYFEDTIDVEHGVMCSDLMEVLDLDFSEYPCINNIGYGSYNDIFISYSNDKISTYESYIIEENSYNNEVESKFAYMEVTLYNSNENLEKEVASSLRMRFLNSDSLHLAEDSITIMQALNHVVPYGQCIETDLGLCLGKTIDNNNGRTATFYIESNT